MYKGENKTYDIASQLEAFPDLITVGKTNGNHFTITNRFLCANDSIDFDKKAEIRTSPHRTSVKRRLSHETRFIRSLYFDCHKRLSAKLFK